MQVEQTPTSELHPFSELTPSLEGIFLPLSAAKRTELLSSIVTKGIATPLLVWRGFVVDGHNRLDIARELFMQQVPCNHRDDLTQDEAEALYIELNYARRQLTSKEKVQAAKALREIVARQKGLSKPVEAPDSGDDLVVTVGDQSSGEDELGYDKAATAAKGKGSKGKASKAPKATTQGSDKQSSAQSQEAGEGSKAAGTGNRVVGAGKPTTLQVADDTLQGKASKQEVTQEAADRLGVSPRQFATLEQAGDAPAPVVDAIGAPGGFSVKEAAQVGKAATDPRTADQVMAAVEGYKEAAQGDNPDAVENARKGVLQASKRPGKGLGSPESQTPLKSLEKPLVERDPESMLEAKFDPAKGRLTIYDHDHPKSPALVMVNLAPLENHSQDYIISRVQAAMKMAQDLLLENL